MKKHIPVTLALLLGAFSLLSQVEAPLPVPDASPGQVFGESVSVSPDGVLTLVGAPFDNEGATGAGAAYVFQREGTDWQFLEKIMAGDASPFDNFGQAVALSAQGQYALVGAPLDDDNGNESGAAYVFFKEGETWTQQAKLLPSDGASLDWFGYSVALNASGNVALVGAHQHDAGGDDTGAAYVFERTGGEWSEVAKLLPADAAAGDWFGYAVAMDADGQALAVTSHRDDDNGEDSGAAYAFSQNGGTWMQTQKILPSNGSPQAWFGRAIAMHHAGDRLAIGAPTDGSGEGGAYVFSLQGGTWVEHAGLSASDGSPGDHFGNAVAMGGDLLSVAAFGHDGNGNDSGSVYRFRDEGNDWIPFGQFLPNDGGAGHNFGESISSDMSGDIIAVGARSSDTNGTLSGAAYVLDYSDWLFVTGVYVADMDGDCSYSEGDIPMQGEVLAFDPTDGPGSYASCDSSGVFGLILQQTGDYAVLPSLPNDYWAFCQPLPVISNDAGAGNLPLAPIVIQPQVSCPFMEVGISVGELERCFNSIYQITYRNTGTVPAQGVYIELSLDPFLLIQSSGLPWTTSPDGTHVFDVGDVGILESGSFNVEVWVDCDAELGQTHCAEARAYPNGYCSPVWDGAVLDVTSECENDTVKFRIQNIGAGDMGTVRQAQIIEDMVMKASHDVQLNSGESTIIPHVAEGATLHCIIEQVPGYPYPNGKIFAAHEGCGTNANGGFSTGLMNVFPDNDELPFIAADCRPNVGAFDPNAKYGFAEGYGESHYIEADTDLEYLIRFQNTGTDTARNVLLLDTLPGFVNPSSIRLEGASHPFQFDMEAGGVCRFYFRDIMLPDSLSNEPSSHGYVKFIVEQTEGNLPGTLIENNASIYFDFNDAIVTNTVFHTIAGFDYITADTLGSPVLSLAPMVELKVSPNPCHDMAHFELQGWHGGELELLIFSVDGRLIQSARYDNPSFNHPITPLASGIYIYQIRLDSMPVATGKIGVY